MREPVLAIHGGCGAIPKAELTPALNKAARAGLHKALEAGFAVLTAGGNAFDAVMESVVILEDDPVFNAGFGAALNRDGIHELDSSLMDGATGRAGAVAGTKRIRNPVRVARTLMEKSDPLLLIAQAADDWAAAHGFEMVENSYFTTPSRRESLALMLNRETTGNVKPVSERDKHGTVGAVALDVHGHLAAATSTGGYTAKPAGRVGDSPIIGAGTWADDRTCAISGTGKGELFIRLSFGHEVHARMLYQGMSLEKAINGLIHDEMVRLENGAGACAIDLNGNVMLPYNTEGMYRGWIRPEGAFVAIHET
jgi:L-asparaginase / beta-aspartyl-peptidase